ncbi:MAG: DoxX family membrane protein [Chloroflexi bacterium]|nr:MAG: DoxX family membrane protein [Chloroflexota bacterium]MBL1194389.1 DoxX family membrane protein [Chloroflexota bacterium]NOH11677.1 DoxX family protein [Chloroflexota bacterium]
MNILLWVLQVLFGLYFLAIGIMHFIVPEGLPAQMEWMYSLSTPLHYVSGTAEILGGLGLILPGLTRIQPRLTTWAALGLATVMILAIGYHVTRGELQNVAFNVVLALVTGFIAYGRAKLSPLAGRA